MRLHCVSKNDIDVARYNFNAYQPILVIFVDMLLKEYPIKWWFVIPPVLTNVSALAYLGKHEPRKLCLFSHAAYRVSKTKRLDEE